MAHIYSRVNGLRIGIPSDARNIVHRFAIGGGGNELIFQPIKRKDYEQSLRTEGKPVEMGSVSEPVPTEGNMASVALTVNVADDDEPEVVVEDKPKTRKGRSTRKDVEETVI